MTREHFTKIVGLYRPELLTSQLYESVIERYGRYRLLDHRDFVLAIYRASREQMSLPELAFKMYDIHRRGKLREVEIEQITQVSCITTNRYRKYFHNVICIVFPLTFLSANVFFSVFIYQKLKKGKSSMISTRKN